MAKLMQQSSADFFSEDGFIAFGKIPEVFEEQNNLRRQHHRTLIGKLRAGEKPQRIRLDAIRQQTRVRGRFQGDWQFRDLLAQRDGQGGERRFNLRFRELLQMFPMNFH